MKIESFDKINIRLTHPNLWRSILTFAFIYIGLGFNFLFTNPPFNPYNIDKIIIGLIFLSLGLSKILFLIFVRNLKWLRLMITLGIIFTIFWGVGTSITFFQGKTSLQLFILYIGMGFLNTFLLIEPTINILSKPKDND